MQTVSSLYREIIASGNYWTETSLAIGERGVLVTKRGDRITFGGNGIYTSIAGGNSGYGENVLISLQTSGRVFSGNTPSVGDCIAGVINVTMWKPSGNIATQAVLVPYVRITDGTRYSEWLQKGVFYVDTREEVSSGVAGGRAKLTLQGFDAMLMAEADYPPSTQEWPRADIDVVRDIATAMGVGVDARTVEAMNKGYTVQYPSEYSMREALGFIAAMYAGCFIMTDTGELRLVQFSQIPKETNYLCTENGLVLLFGGERILV